MRQRQQSRKTPDRHQSNTELAQMTLRSGLTLLSSLSAEIGSARSVLDALRKPGVIDELGFLMLSGAFCGAPFIGRHHTKAVHKLCARYHAGLRLTRLPGQPQLTGLQRICVGFLPPRRWARWETLHRPFRFRLRFPGRDQSNAAAIRHPGRPRLDFITVHLHIHTSLVQGSTLFGE
jgi:hypothetical protein